MTFAELLPAIRPYLPDPIPNPGLLVWTSHTNKPILKEGIGIPLEVMEFPNTEFHVNREELSSRLPEQAWIAWFRFAPYGEEQTVFAYDLRPLGGWSRIWLDEQLVGRVCRYCGEFFQPSRKDQIYHTDICSRRGRKREFMRRTRENMSITS